MKYFIYLNLYAKFEGCERSLKVNSRKISINSYKVFIFSRFLAHEFMILLKQTNAQIGLHYLVILCYDIYHKRKKE